MPEGPEVYILSKAINNYYGYDKTTSYGKELIIYNDNTSSIDGEIWSFGLSGKVQINNSNELVKITTDIISGTIKDLKLKKDKAGGVDWMSASKEVITTIVSSWTKSKKKLAGLLMDQTLIAGIGIAWGSEILFLANLRPDLKACEQDLTQLAQSIFDIATMIKSIYDTVLMSNPDKKIFINEWYQNLYKIREMHVYKKGEKIDVLGRTWWIKK